jgi:hypothetical protein
MKPISMTLELNGNSKYKITFHNSYSLMKKKELNYRMIILNKKTVK